MDSGYFERVLDAFQDKLHIDKVRDHLCIQYLTSGDREATLLMLLLTTPYHIMTPRQERVVICASSIDDPLPHDHQLSMW